jgi:ABC-type hemin transport system ATPase subunit
LIEAKGLVQLVRGGRRTLDDVSLSVRPGELLAIIGASGAGRTTLLDALSGMRLPASGSFGIAFTFGDLQRLLDFLARAYRDRRASSEGLAPRLRC